jgi:uncharacterized membrane protein (UPF0127 family)
VRNTHTLASEVETTHSVVARGVGLMYRCSVLADYALVFLFGRTPTRRLHTAVARLSALT